MHMECVWKSNAARLGVEHIIVPYAPNLRLIGTAHYPEWLNCTIGVPTMLADTCV